MNLTAKRLNHKVKLAMFFLVAVLLLASVGFLVKKRSSFNFFFFKKFFAHQEIVSPVVEDEKTLLKEMVEKAGEKIELPILAEGENLVATLSSGTTVLLKRTADHRRELASLQVILRNIRIEGKWPVKIDLRFSRPVLSY